MGYTTDFSGELTLSKPLTISQQKYINQFSQTRRMARKVDVLMELYKGNGGLPGTSAKSNTPEEIYGKEGEYFVGGEDSLGLKDSSVIDNNTPPGQIGYDVKMDFEKRWKENTRRTDAGECQPGLWCQWIVEGDEDGMVLKWDEVEKFYEYVNWLKYLINHFFSKWGVLLNGEIEWYGEDRSDMGKIIVKDNVVKTKVATVTFDDEEEE